MAVVVSESVEIAAPVSAVYEAVSDVSRTPEWSPEVVRVRVRGGGAGPASVGTRFSGQNRTGTNRPWSTQCTVVVARRDEEFAFRVRAAGVFPIATWRFTFTPSADGRSTTVTESTVDLRGWTMLRLGTFLSGVPDRDTHNRRNIRTTLERLKKHLESVDHTEAGTKAS